ncbi:MAG TPA: dihydrolipoyl dehydrogenase [Nitrososphaeraceae archaeon]|nr:dihydrolipoyl dehydrogenase [Nitrososphaeraceae archaeon]
MQKYDLIVIGAGSGLDIANAAAQKGLTVALIEKDKLGGTCLNRGCIPSKLLIHSSDVIQTLNRASLFGIKIDGISIDYQKIVNRVNRITDSDSEEIMNGLQQSENPILFTKKCTFIGHKTIAIGEIAEKNNYASTDGNGEQIITAEKIVIAAGTRPRIPKIKGLIKSGFITSDEALRLQKQPRILTFVGGGYIACELAHFFGSLGTTINIIERNDFLIPKEDEEISRKFTEVFAKKYNLYLGFETELVLSNNNSSNNDSNSIDKRFHIIAKNKAGKKIELESDQLLVSVGRIPNTDLLNLKNTGVKINGKGFVEVDKYLETTAKGIFALGDIVGRYQFKHNANLEAKYVYNNIIYPNRRQSVNYTAMPHAIFSSPQVAGVGFTEQELKKKNMLYNKSIYQYINTGMGKALEDKDGFVKFIVDKNNRKILGCHIIGTDASILIHEVLVGMRTGDGTIDSITKTIHIHPALSEVVVRAAEEV